MSPEPKTSAPPLPTDLLNAHTNLFQADNQQTVQFPVFQGERVNCEDNTSLGEFTLAPIPPMKAGDAVLEVVFEVDVNGILKVTATEKTSGRSANITISNSVGKLSSSEIESMINGQPPPPSFYVLYANI
jgi:molecular chaperone DnaK (HSP70)